MFSYMCYLSGSCLSSDVFCFYQGIYQLAESLLGFKDGNEWFINSPNLNKAYNGRLLVWWHRREWQRCTDINLSLCCLPVIRRSPTRDWDSNQSLEVNRLERLAGPALPFRSWDYNFSGVCVGSRASFLYLDFRKGIAVEQRALSFLISVNDKENSPMHLPVPQWGNVSSPLTYRLPKSMASGTFSPVVLALESRSWRPAPGAHCSVQCSCCLRMTSVGTK